jgi:hypothetical protein
MKYKWNTPTSQLSRNLRTVLAITEVIESDPRWVKGNRNYLLASSEELHKFQGKMKQEELDYLEEINAHRLYAYLANEFFCG